MNTVSYISRSESILENAIRVERKSNKVKDMKVSEEVHRVPDNQELETVGKNFSNKKLSSWYLLHEPGNKVGYEPSYKPSYEPGYEAGYEPGYEPDYEPDAIGFSPYSRIYIYRDYTGAFGMKFTSDIPTILVNEMHVEEHLWKNTMDEINSICREAEKIGRSILLENLAYFMSLYFLLTYKKSHYTKCMERLRKYIENQNKEIYDALGLKILNPAQNGYRFIEVVINYLKFRTTLPILRWGNDYPKDSIVQFSEFDFESEWTKSESYSLKDIKNY